MARKYQLEWKLQLLDWLMKRYMPPHTENPTQVRAISSNSKGGLTMRLRGSKTQLHAIENRTIEGRNGQIPIRIYRPSNQPNLPVIVFFHGGGWVIGDLESHDAMCRQISARNNIIVVAVDYRLAPENKYPAAAHDCYDATVWVSKHTAELGVDHSKLIVMGDSAGGNLAAVVSQMARDLQGPAIAYQVLIYPVTDGTLSHPSLDEHCDAPILTRSDMEHFVKHYQQTQDDVLEPYFSPLLATDFTNLPPAFIVTAEYDPLRDEGRAYAAHLRQAGNDVIFKDYSRMPHGFFSFGNMASQSQTLHADLTAVLQPFTTPQPNNGRAKPALISVVILGVVGAALYAWYRRQQ